MFTDGQRPWRVLTSWCWVLRHSHKQVRKSRFSAEAESSKFTQKLCFLAASRWTERPSDQKPVPATVGRWNEWWCVQSKLHYKVPAIQSCDLELVNSIVVEVHLYGYTDGCVGCNAARWGRVANRQSLECPGQIRIFTTLRIIAPTTWSTGSTAGGQIWTCSWVTTRWSGWWTTRTFVAAKNKEIDGGTSLWKHRFLPARIHV